MNNYNHLGTLSDSSRMVQWLGDNKGYLFAPEYEVFVQMAKLLEEKDYNTDCPPTEAEFLTGLRKAQRR